MREDVRFDGRWKRDSMEEGRGKTFEGRCLVM